MKTWKTCLLAASLAAFTFAPQTALAKAPTKQSSKKTNANQAIYNQAIAAVQKGDYSAAFKILEPLAKKGDATAQHNLAVLYQDGLGTKTDAKQALYWYEKAAAQGEPEAQFMAGLMYSDGTGTAQDYKKAAYWYEKAAKKGHSEAQNNLAARYATGSGVNKDMAKAKYWYRKAAAQGNQSAAYTLQQLEALEKSEQKGKGSLKTQMLNEAQKASTKQK